MVNDGFKNLLEPPVYNHLLGPEANYFLHVPSPFHMEMLEQPQKSCIKDTPRGLCGVYCNGEGDVESGRERKKKGVSKK